MANHHEGLLTRFTAKFEPSIIEKWVAMIDTWDMDSSKPNPYEEPQKGVLGCGRKFITAYKYYHSLFYGTGPTGTCRGGWTGAESGCGFSS